MYRGTTQKQYIYEPEASERFDREKGVVNYIPTNENCNNFVKI